MSKKSITSVLAAAACTAALADGLLLVLPANVSLINLGFDLMRMKPAGEIEMVCYGGTDEVTSLEWFDRGAYRWMAAPQSSWNAGTIPGASQDTLVIVGDGSAASDLLEAAAWADNILTPTGHSFHEIANAVHSVSPLSKKQWKSLEKGYGISLREIQVPSRYDRAPPSRYDRGGSVPATPATFGGERPDFSLEPTEIIISTPEAEKPAQTVVAETAPVESSIAEEAAKLEAEKKAAEEAAKLEAEKKAAEDAAKLEAERKAAEEAARKAAEEAAKLETERKAAEEAAKLEAEKKAAEEAARKAAEEAAELEAKRKAAEEAAKQTFQQALDKAKAEVSADGNGDAAMIAAPPVDISTPAITFSTPAMSIPEAPVTTVVVPELPVVPAPITTEQK